MDELVSRQAVKDWLKRWRGYLDDDMITRMQIRTIDIPTIEPKRGKWINDGKPYALYQCSVCNDFCTVAGYANCIPEKQMYKTMKYCPNCGAEMKRDEDEYSD